ncbi:NADH-dependent flavin oxidoreductase iliE [Cladobotryum mycophilum]|uniref:NADH-dependent flavin oxidoreductase iliE n=1 Tax=Cladobotryum mycophilum TaxID=491253 RepID=A0ABR0SUE9_9HYPO
MAFKASTVMVVSGSTSILRSSFASPTCCHFSHPRSSQSSSCPPHSLLPSARGQRSYATVHITDPTSNDNSLPPWPRSAHPTPYEIFGLQKDAIYNKRAYYKLAKLYHPDTNASSSFTSTPDSSSSSPKTTVPNDATRLERYRLLVAAHELLSDPAKRRLYDTTGLGWDHDHRAPSLRDIDRSWRNQPGSAANNATWEDWQRWHDARDGRSSSSSEPVYMSHGMFASMVVVLCMIGWMAQLNRAESSGDQYVAWLSEQNATIGSQLMKDTLESAGRTRDQRVDNFLKDRENTLYQYEPTKYEKDDGDGPPRDKPM